MSMKRRTNQKTKMPIHTPQKVQNQPLISLKNSSKQSAKNNSDLENEATTSAVPSPSNRLSENLNVELEKSTDEREKITKSEQTAWFQQPIEPLIKEKNEEETAVPDSSSSPASFKFKRGKSWIDPSDNQCIAENLARRTKFVDIKGFKRSSSLNNKLLKPNRESIELNKDTPKNTKPFPTEHTKEESPQSLKMPAADNTTASAECKAKHQEFRCQERSSSAESAATQILNTELKKTAPQILNTEFQNTKDQSITEKLSLCDKSYALEPKLVLYYNILSPQARSCLMLMNFLNLDLELRYADQLLYQQLSEDFQKINAWHTIPKLVHNDLVLTDSHTILMYLCVTFSSPEAQQLFPSCPLTRLKIMNMLFFEAQVLFRRYSNYMTDIVRKEIAKIDFDSHRCKIFEAYEMLNGFLKNSQFLVGDSFTLADISVVATFSSLDLMFPIDSYKDFWPRLAHWFEAMSNMPMYLLNNTGVKKQRDVITSFGKNIIPK